MALKKVRLRAAPAPQYWTANLFLRARNSLFGKKPRARLWFLDDCDSLEGRGSGFY